MPLTEKEMLKLLKKNGWQERRQEGPHHHLYKDGINLFMTIKILDEGSSNEF